MSESKRIRAAFRELDHIALNCTHGPGCEAGLYVIYRAISALRFALQIDLASPKVDLQIENYLCGLGLGDWWQTGFRGSWAIWREPIAKRFGITINDNNPIWARLREAAVAA